MEKITRVDNGDAVREILEQNISYTLFYGKQVASISQPFPEPENWFIVLINETGYAHYFKNLLDAEAFINTL
jgi:hypothetical protein